MEDDEVVNDPVKSLASFGSIINGIGVPDIGYQSAHSLIRFGLSPISEGDVIGGGGLLWEAQRRWR